MNATQDLYPMIRFLPNEGDVGAVITTDGRMTAAFEIESGEPLWSMTIADTLSPEGLLGHSGQPFDRESFSIRGLCVDAESEEIVLLVAAPPDSSLSGHGGPSAVVVLDREGQSKRQLPCLFSAALAAPRLIFRESTRFMALGYGSTVTLYPIDDPGSIAHMYHLYHVTKSRTPGGQIWSDAPPQHEMGRLTTLDAVSVENLQLICGWEGGEVQRACFSGDSGSSGTTKLVHKLSPRDENDFRSSSSPYLHNVNLRDVIGVALIQGDEGWFGISAGIDGRVVLEDGTVLFDSEPSLRYTSPWGMEPIQGADFSEFSKSVTAMAHCESLLAFSVDNEFAASTENPSTRRHNARPVHLVDARTATVIQTFAVPDGPVRALDLVVEPETTKVAVQTDSTVALWDSVRRSITWSRPLAPIVRGSG